jgi:hypothetical protein
MAIKKNMEADTIFFIGKRFAKSYNYEYYRRNFTDIQKELGTPERVYYKVNDEFSSWIKYKEAMRNLKGTPEERMQKALETPAYRLSSELTELPSCTYTDSEGYTYFIAPNDGKVNPTYWLDREDIVQTEPIIEIENVGTEVCPVINLHVKFDYDISNAIVTLNNLFLPYELVNNKEILYIDVQDSLKRVDLSDMDTGRELRSGEVDNYGYYNTDIGVYKWAGSKKLPFRTPKKKIEDVIEFADYVDVNGMIFYNGIYYRHELVDDPEGTGKGFKIRLLDVRPEYCDYFNIDEIQYVKFVSTDGTDNLKKFEIRGLNNLFPNEVEFPFNITNSLITTGGLDLTYIMKDRYSIEYPLFDNGLDSSLDSSTPVYATCFYAGLSGMGAGYTTGFEPQDAYDIISNLTNKLQLDYKNKMNDYTDYLEFNPDNPREFYLEFKPIIYNVPGVSANNIRLAINGIRYHEGTHFTYDKKTNCISWNYTKDQGGFDLQEKYSIVAIYDFLFEENGISVEEQDDFMREYVKYLTEMQIRS